MSGNTTIDRPHLAVFVSAAFTETDQYGDTVVSSLLQKALDSPQFAGVFEWLPISPAFDASGKMIAPLTLCLVKSPTTALINDLDAVQDIIRLSLVMTEAQRTSVEGTLRGIAQQHIELTNCATLEQMASRVAFVINPLFQGFPPGWFSTPEAV